MLTTLPVALFLVVPLVFVVTVGEIDLSFPATMGFACLGLRAAWCRPATIRSSASPRRSSPACVLGFVVGALVVYGGLSSLIATLGMNFMLRGLILIITQGKSIALPQLADSSAFKIFSTADLRHSGADLLGRRLRRASARCSTTGTASAPRCTWSATIPTAPRRWASTSSWIRVKVFVFMGIGAALAGVFSTMINFTWWPTAGDGYLLPVLASVFVGGTPTWGGIGTVTGGAIGALTVSFIQTGVVAPGSQRLLRAVLQRPDHHPVAARAPLEPDPLPLGMALQRRRHAASLSGDELNLVGRNRRSSEQLTAFRRAPARRRSSCVGCSGRWPFGGWWV